MHSKMSMNNNATEATLMERNIRARPLGSMNPTPHTIWKLQITGREPEGLCINILQNRSRDLLYAELFVVAVFFFNLYNSFEGPIGDVCGYLPRPRQETSRSSCQYSNKKSERLLPSCDHLEHDGGPTK